MKNNPITILFIGNFIVTIVCTRVYVYVFYRVCCECFNVFVYMFWSKFPSAIWKAKETDNILYLSCPFVEIKIAYDILCEFFAWFFHLFVIVSLLFLFRSSFNDHFCFCSLFIFRVYVINYNYYETQINDKSFFCLFFVYFFLSTFSIWHSTLYQPLGFVLLVALVCVCLSNQPTIHSCGCSSNPNHHNSLRCNFEKKIKIKHEYMLRAIWRKYSIFIFKFLFTYHPGTSSGSSQLPVPSPSPILKTVPIGQPYSRATPSKQM